MLILDLALILKGVMNERRKDEVKGKEIFNPDLILCTRANNVQQEPGEHGVVIALLTESRGGRDHDKKII